MTKEINHGGRRTCAKRLELGTEEGGESSTTSRKEPGLQGKGQARKEGIAKWNRRLKEWEVQNTEQRTNDSKLPELSKVAEVIGYGRFVTETCMAILDSSDFWRQEN